VVCVYVAGEVSYFIAEVLHRAGRFTLVKMELENDCTYGNNS